VLRTACVLLLAAAISALAGAQGPGAGLTAAQQQQLFQRNRQVVAALVDSSLDVSDASGDYVKRSKSYRQVVAVLHAELSAAAQREDGTRVAEIGQHLDTVLSKGLTPSLRAAAGQVGPGGTGEKDLREIRDRSLELADWLQGQAKSKWADTPEVRAVIEALGRSKSELRSSINP
jgi:hypothetical protein